MVWREKVRPMECGTALPTRSDCDVAPVCAGARGHETSSCSVEAGLDLEQIFAQYIGPVYGFLYKRVGNREDAEDLASEVFLKASRKLDLAQPEARVGGWLFTVARTVLADHWRTHYRHGGWLPLEEYYNYPETETASPSELPSAAVPTVDAILSALPVRYRRVLELRFLTGYSIQETAEDLGVSPANAKVLQHRALAKAVQSGERAPQTDWPPGGVARVGQSPGCEPKA
jgi:RNA polymerase sigma factor (sigma-70 family)